MMIGETVNPRTGLFVPTMKVLPPAPQQLAPQLVTEVEVPSLPGPSEAGVVEGSDCLVPGGRLSTFWQVWEAKRAHPRVVTILKEGYCLNCRLKPPLTKVPVIRSKYLNRETQQFLIKAVYQMIDKRAITPVQKVTSLGFYSRLFLVPKPGKKWRPVIDLSVVNKYLHVPTFKMETAENIRNSLQQGEWVTSLDLTDAYFHIPIHPRFQKYLRFNVGDRSYQFTALPFGIATGPLQFTMVAKQVKLMALAEGIRIHQYIDDWLMRAKTKQQCQENTHRLIHLVQSLGWIINFQKTDLIPTQEIEFLGYKFDLRVGLVFPTQKKIDCLLEKTVSMLKATQTYPRELMSLIGSMASMEKTIPLGHLHMRPLQWYLKTHWRYPQSLDIPVPVSQVLKQHLQWWTNLSNLKRGFPLHQNEHNLLLFTDASLKGWGAHLNHHTASGLWNQVESKLHINILELKAVFLALKSFENHLLNQNLLISTDNSSVVAYLNKQGGTHSQEMCALIWRIMAWTNARGIQIRAKHIPGNLNMLADSLSRKDKVIQTEWALNHQVLNQICHCWHQPMVDLFATKLNHKLPMYVSPVPDSRAWETDALNISWHLLGGSGCLCVLSSGSHSTGGSEDGHLQVQNHHDCTRVARDVLVLGSGGSVHKAPSETSLVGGSVDSTFQQQTSQQSDLPEPSCFTSGVSLEGSRGFSEEVAKRIKEPQRHSSRRIYESRWSIFVSGESGGHLRSHYSRHSKFP